MKIKAKLAVAVTMLVLAGGNAFAEALRPNIVYIYLDDLGWGAIGPNGQRERRAGGQPSVLTPTIDRLAGEGLNFSRAYGATVCSPARSSQQTGFHQGHTYADRNDPDNARKAIRAGDESMGRLLKEAGYVTGYWGKWGFGGSDDLNNPTIVNRQTLPTAHGYDYVVAELHHVRAHTFFQPTLWVSGPGDDGMALEPNTMLPYTGDTAAYPDYPSRQNDPAYPATAYADDVYSFAALDFVREQSLNYSQTGQPFFALLACQIPHSPYDEIRALPGWDEAYADDPHFAGLSDEAKGWAAMVTRLDAHIANILAALEDPNNDGDTSDSVSDNTLVIVASDNGGPANEARSVFNANGGLRGAKTDIWEGGIRVPMVVRWPSRIHDASLPARGGSTDMVVDVTDLLPTFAELAGVEPPLGIDGVSIAPSLSGSGHQRTREFLVHEAQPDASVIRGNHKLVKRNGSLELYDLAADPGETTDIASSNGQLVSELSAIREAERVGEPQWFANTYHHWTGGDGAVTSSSANWSDYDYTNEVNGVTYQTAGGSPALSWVARMVNAGPTASTAVVDRDLSVLALGLRGESASAVQSLRVEDHTVTGRNEIRVGPNAVVELDNGGLASARWIDLLPGGEIRGAGVIDADLHQDGLVSVTGSSPTVVSDAVELVRNGGFEDGVATGDGDYSFQTLEHWTTDGDPGRDATKPNNAYSGNHRGLIANQDGVANLVQDTGATIQPGDSYTLSFWHRGFLNWDSGETARARVFYVNGDGERVSLFEETFPLAFGTWNQESHSFAAPGAGDAIGRNLWLLLEPAGGSGFASFDEVSLARDGDPVEIPGVRRVRVAGDLRQGANARLRVTLAGTGSAGEDYGELVVDGEAVLGGLLLVDIDPSYTPAVGDAFAVLTASSISGEFANPNGLATSAGGTPFVIGREPGRVTLTATARTSRGTPHLWFDQFGIGGGDYEAADVADADGDGRPAHEEYLAGTSPVDSLSAFAGSLGLAASGDALRLSWPSTLNRLYRILRSTDAMRSFQPVTENVPATPPENTFDLPAPGVDDPVFFKIEAEVGH